MSHHDGSEDGEAGEGDAGFSSDGRHRLGRPATSERAGRHDGERRGGHGRRHAACGDKGELGVVSVVGPPVAPS